MPTNHRRDLEVRPGDRPSAARHNALVNAALRNHTGHGTFVDSSGVYKRPALQDRRAERTIHITASTATGVNDANGNPVQWTYQAEEVVKTTAGYGAWSAKEGGWTGTAYNGMEDGNTGTGVQGNGVDHDGDDYPAGFAMQPIQAGTIVAATIVTLADGTQEAWFAVPNGEDGTCEA